MTLYLLRDIPREIRDQIYMHVLSSPYGCVSVQPSTDRSWGPSDDARLDIVPVNPRTYIRDPSEPAIRLNLLRTCSQIHLEARNVLWQTNTLAFPQPTSLYSHSRLLDPRFSYGVQSVQLRTDLMTLQSPTAMDGALRILAKWAREGSLRSLTLTILSVQPHERGMELLGALMEFWNLAGLFRQNQLPHQHPSAAIITYCEFLLRLKEAGDYLPAGLKRRIVLNTDWNDLSMPAKRAWLERRKEFYPQNLIQEIHERFGGEFWMDGKLCFKDHIEVENVFDVPPDVGHSN